MKILKSRDIETSRLDDPLYNRLISLLKEIKLVRGGTDLAYTLRNHPKIKNYCEAKQRYYIDYIESTFFNPDGSLDPDSLSGFEKSSLHNN